MIVGVVRWLTPPADFGSAHPSLCAVCLFVEDTITSTGSKVDLARSRRARPVFHVAVRASVKSARARMNTRACGSGNPSWNSRCVKRLARGFGRWHGVRSIAAMQIIFGFAVLFFGILIVRSRLGEYWHAPLDTFWDDLYEHWMGRTLVIVFGVGMAAYGAWLLAHTFQFGGPVVDLLGQILTSVAGLLHTRE